MGMFENLENQALTGLLGNSSNPLATSILHMIQNQPGGLQALLQSFQNKGLGELVAGWVSTGPNPPVSADQLHEVLGSDRIKQLAAAAGISPDVAGPAIAQLLPTLVDKLTPHGQVPEPSDLSSMASGVLASFMQAKAS